jgi:hypothetical protein
VIYRVCSKRTWPPTLSRVVVPTVITGNDMSYCLLLTGHQTNKFECFRFLFICTKNIVRSQARRNHAYRLINHSLATISRICRRELIKTAYGLLTSIEPSVGQTFLTTKNQGMVKGDNVFDRRVLRREVQLFQQLLSCLEVTPFNEADKKEVYSNRKLKKVEST